MKCMIAVIVTGTLVSTGSTFVAAAPATAPRKAQQFPAAQQAKLALEEFGPAVVPQVAAKWREMKYGEPPYGGLLYDLLLKQPHVAAPLVMDGLDLPDLDAAQNVMHVVAAGGDGTVSAVQVTKVDVTQGRTVAKLRIGGEVGEQPIEDGPGFSVGRRRLRAEP